MGPRGLTRSALLALAVVLSSPLARAQSSAPPSANESMPARVRVVLPACTPPPFDVEPFVSVLRIELETDGVERVDVAAPGASLTDESELLATIVLDAAHCAPEVRELTVRIDDAATRKHVERVIALGDVPRDQAPRALALAVAELLRASWSELALPDAPPPPARLEPSVRRIVVLRALQPRPPARAVRTIPRDERIAIGGAMEVRLFPSVNSALLGARALVTIPVPGVRLLRIHADAGALYGSASQPVGTIDEFLGTGALGVAIAGGAGALLGEVGPRFEVGGGWVAGHSITPNAATDSGAYPVAFLSMVGSVRVRIAPDWWLHADVEAGAAVVSLLATVDGARAGGFWGPMAGIRIGIAGEP